MNITNYIGYLRTYIEVLRTYIEENCGSIFIITFWGTILFGTFFFANTSNYNDGNESRKYPRGRRDSI